MSWECVLLGQLPGEAANEDVALEQIGEALKLPVSLSPDNSKQIRTQGLWINGSAPDEDDTSLTERRYGFRNNIAIVFSDFTSGDEDAMVNVYRQVVLAATSFASVPGFIGVLIEDYDDDGYMARIADQKVVWNSKYWEGWPAAKAILSAVGRSPVFSSLHVQSR
jgi:hypothetical protein